MAQVCQKKAVRLQVGVLFANFVSLKYKPVGPAVIWAAYPQSPLRDAVQFITVPSVFPDSCLPVLVAQPAPTQRYAVGGELLFLYELGAGLCVAHPVFHSHHLGCVTDDCPYTQV